MARIDRITISAVREKGIIMKPTLVLIAALVLAGPLAAQTPSDARVEAALALMEAMDMEEVMKETMEESMAQQAEMMSMLNGGALPDSLLTASMEIGRKWAIRALEWSTLRHDLARLYAETYTVDQLRQLEDFYRSPVGRLLLDTTPELTAGTQEIMSRRMQAIMPEMMQEMMEVMGHMPR